MKFVDIDERLGQLWVDLYGLKKMFGASWSEYGRRMRADILADIHRCEMAKKKGYTQVDEGNEIFVGVGDNRACFVDTCTEYGEIFVTDNR